MPAVPARRRLCWLALTASALAGLQGCAGLAVVHPVAILAKQTTPDPSREALVAERGFDQPVDGVWAALLRVAEQDGRQIVERDDGRHVLRLHYPFSWLQNKWGGELTFQCSADDRHTVQGAAQGAAQAASVVRVVGGATDAPSRIRQLAEDILRQVAMDLQARTATPPP